MTFIYCTIIYKPYINYEVTFLKVQWLDTEICMFRIGEHFPSA